MFETVKGGKRKGLWGFLICIMMAGEGGMICWRMTSILILGRVIYLVYLVFGRVEWHVTKGVGGNLDVDGCLSRPDIHLLMWLLL